MLNTIDTNQVFLFTGNTDMRKSIDGLAAIVQLEFNVNPFSNAYFVFCGKTRDKIKILHWDVNGFWLYYKRLEKGKIKWPKHGEQINVTMRELRWLLDGLEPYQQQAYKPIDMKYTV